MTDERLGRDQMLGRTLGHYRIVEKLGAGGMGEVYRAHDERLHRDVALKILLSNKVTDEAARKRFRKEALALSKLNHPNVATVFDFDSQQGVDFLVMEYVAGQTFTDKLSAGPLPEKETARLGLQLAEGLTAAHEQGIVHRDLKPGNVKLTSDGRLKILDFGLARLVKQPSDAAETASLTEAQAPVGTLPYMSPEQLHGEEVDPRTDIWAAGLVLYEMATGCRAFAEAESVRLVTAILTETPPPPSGLNHRVSPGLESIIVKCLEKDPEHRYQSAKELAVDLRRLGAPLSAGGIRPAGRIGLRPWIVTGGALLAVSVFAVIFILNAGGWRQRVLGSLAAPHIRSIAVLPLANLSGDPEQEYFADGMTEELITTLAHISALNVISRTSVMLFKGTKKPLPQIARELGVDAVIEGSVLRAGDRVRITAQLIEATKDRHLWAESYERDMRDVLALQSEMASTIAREVKAQLTPQERARLASRSPVDPDAYQASVRGRYFLTDWTPDGVNKAIENFRQAIRFDPAWPPPYGGLAISYAMAGTLGLQAPAEGFGRARAAALKAIELDDGLADAHAALSLIMLTFDWDWPGAERECRKAASLNPNSIEAIRACCWCFTYLGRTDEAVAAARKALELDPLSRATNLHVGWVLYYARRHDESIAQFRKALELYPSDGWAHMQLAWNLIQMDMREEALAECRKAAAVAPEDGMVLGTGAWVYALAGRSQKALELLDRWRRVPAPEHVASYIVALVYDALGDTDQALEWLHRAYAERDPNMPGVRCEYWTERTRSDPRFQDLLRRMNFPPD
jgi:TolB-like protein/tetratricopeptide (TPR) repeat protein/predicted Ser/Thr protein kinase